MGAGTVRVVTVAVEIPVWVWGRRSHWRSCGWSTRSVRLMDIPWPEFPAGSELAPPPQWLPGPLPQSCRPAYLEHTREQKQNKKTCKVTVRVLCKTPLFLFILVCVNQSMWKRILFSASEAHLPFVYTVNKQLSEHSKCNRAINCPPAKSH